MDKIDGNVFALITGVVFGLLEAIKLLAPARMKEWLDGKEPAFSWIFSVGGVVIAKLTGAFHGTGWTDALLWACGSGIGAGAVHDYLWDPLSKLVKASPAAAGTAAKMLLFSAVLSSIAWGGCQSVSLDQKIMGDYKRAHDVVLPEYLQAVDGRPLNLTDAQKADRRAVVQKLIEIDLKGSR